MHLFRHRSSNKKAQDFTLKWNELQETDVLDGSAFLDNVKVPAARELKKLGDSIIDQRRLWQRHQQQWQTFLPAEAVEEFAKERCEFVSGVDCDDRPRQGDHRDVLRRSGTLQRRRKRSARGILLQSCDKWLNDNGVSERLTPKLFIPVSKALAKEKQQHISPHDHQ